MREKWASGANAVRKLIIKFNKRQDKYKALVSKAKDKDKYSAAELKIWYSVCKTKENGVIPSKADEVWTYTTTLKDCELLTTNQFLLNLEYGEDLVEYILNGDDDRDRDGNGINDGDRDDDSISNDGDNNDDASC